MSFRVRYAFSAFAFVATLVLLPILGAPFGPHDDYQLTDMLGPDRVLRVDEAAGVAANLVTHDINRFRPAYYPLRTIEAVLLGDSATAWHVSRLVLLLIAGAFVMALLRGLVPVVALPLLALVLVAGPQAEVWIQLAPNEAYGIPLFLGGLALLRYRHPWPAVVLLLLAGLTKESMAIFNLVLAAVLLWRFRDWPQLAFGAGTLLTVAMVGLTFLGGEPFYAEQRTPESVLETLWGITWYAGLGALAAAVVGVSRRVLMAVPVALAIIVPQAIIGGGAGFDVTGRYYLPGVLAFALLAAAALASSARWRREIVVAVLVAGTAWGAVTARAMADGVAQQAKEIHTAVERVAEWRAENPRGQIVLAPATAFEGEWFAAMVKYLRFEGVELDPAITLEPTTPSYTEFEEVIWAWMETFARFGEAREPCLVVQLGDAESPCEERVVVTSG